MLEVLRMARVACAARQEQLTPSEFERVKRILSWQHKILTKARQERLPVIPSVQALMNYFSCIHGDPIARMYGNQMIEQFMALAPKIDCEASFKTLDEWLLAINYVVQRAPEFEPEKKDQFFFPMSSLFMFYMFTNAGSALFRLCHFNELLTSVLNAWCLFLDSPASLSVLNPEQNTPANGGWLSEVAQEQLCLMQCANYAYRNEVNKPYWKFSSFNDFFHRQWNLKKYRPLAGEGDEDIIVSANDGMIYRIANDVKACDDFWVKGQNYSLMEMLDHSPFSEYFVGGDVMQSFLDSTDYHRWHAPISGKVIEARLIPGLTFSELLSEEPDLSAGTESQGYQAMVNTRALVIIDNPRLGKVGVLPVGLTEVSSIAINVSVGDEVNKGDEMGRFSYGGSSLVLVFEKGLIRHFTAQEPGHDTLVAVNAPSNRCKTGGNCCVQQGCLMVRGAIATANMKQ